jgi:hypothetical protein
MVCEGISHRIVESWFVPLVRRGILFVLLVLVGVFVLRSGWLLSMEMVGNRFMIDTEINFELGVVVGSAGQGFVLVILASPVQSRLRQIIRHVSVEV